MCSKFSQSLKVPLALLGSGRGVDLSMALFRECLVPLQYVSFILARPLRGCLLLELQFCTMDVLVEIIHDGFELNSRLMECSMPAYKSLTVTSQTSSAVKDWLLKRLSFLGAAATSGGQGCKGPHAPREEAGCAGLLRLSVESPPENPGRKAHRVTRCHHSESLLCAGHTV